METSSLTHLRRADHTHRLARATELQRRLHLVFALPVVGGDAAALARVLLLYRDRVRVL